MRYCVRTPLPWRIVDGQLFALTSDGMLHVVEEASGVFLFELLVAGPRSRDELLSELLAEFNVGDQQAASELDCFLAELVAKGVLINK